MIQTKTFLGANTPLGFFSLFDELYNPYKSAKAYIIKGGPGTGKSSLMKKAAKKAQEKGLDTELVYCSSDPNSLDGLLIPELSVCIADGTSPHTIEPKFPGAVENIVNMGAFWNEDELHKKEDSIRSLTIENSLFHRRSARFLASAGAVNDDSKQLLCSSINMDKIDSFALRFAARETPKMKNCSPGKRYRRFISAITPEGPVFFEETIKALSSRVIGIEDEYGSVSGMITERIGEYAVRNGYDVIFCRCPMKPKDCCEHIIIPRIGLTVMTVNSSHKADILPDRLIHSKRFIVGEALSEHKNRLTFNRRLIENLTNESIHFLKKAKEVHDRLEECYIEAMDFEAINEFSERFTQKLFS